MLRIIYEVCKFYTVQYVAQQYLNFRTKSRMSNSEGREKCGLGVLRSESDIGILVLIASLPSSNILFIIVNIFLNR